MADSRKEILNTPRPDTKTVRQTRHEGRQEPGVRVRVTGEGRNRRLVITERVQDETPYQPSL